MSRRRIKDRLCAFPLCYTQRSADCVERSFKLEQRISGISETRSGAFDVACGKRAIGSRDNDNRVLTVCIYADKGNACGFASHRRYGADIDTRRGETRLQVIGKHVIADASDHADQCSRGETSSRACLVRALPAWDHLKTAPKHGLAGRRQMLRPDDEIHVQTSEYDDGGLHGVATSILLRESFTA